MPHACTLLEKAVDSPSYDKAFSAHVRLNLDAPARENELLVFIMMSMCRCDMKILACMHIFHVHAWNI